MADAAEFGTPDGSLDFLELDSLLTERQRALRDRVRAWSAQVILPNINPYWERAEFAREIAFRLKELPIIGGLIEGYGCAGLDFIEAGLAAYELARADGSIATFQAVHSGLAMGAIGMFGAEEQKQRWLPPMARLEKIGAFGLTEPDQGSNAGGIETTARRDGDSYVLNGSKRWIGNASVAQVLIIWARDEAGQFGGFVVEDPHAVEGIEITDMSGKAGKRAVANADIRLSNARIPAENRLALVRSFRDTTRLLIRGRYIVAWEAAGAAAGALDHALAYARQRQQFGKPIAAFQLIQQKLVEMTTEVSLMQLACLRLGELITSGRATEGMISLAKYNNARKARDVTQLAREIMGGNGLLIENHVARLWTDAEIMYTYEGTNEINLLLIGRELTGLSAFI